MSAQAQERGKTRQQQSTAVTAYRMPSGINKRVSFNPTTAIKSTQTQVRNITSVSQFGSAALPQRALNNLLWI